MNSKKLEEVIKNYEVRISKSKEINQRQNFPSMIVVFNKLIENEIPPTQEMFISKFREEHPKAKGIESRLKKAYFSFIREYHLGFLLREEFTEVHYDQDLDIYGGIDYVINCNGGDYSLHAFVDTVAGNKWRQIKEKRHQFTGIHIDFPLNLKEGKRVGKFILYTKEQVRELHKYLDEFNKPNTDRIE